MPLDALNGAKLPASADFHVHLRDGKMMELVVPTIRKGGVNTVFVMPNLVPPVTTVKHALEYKAKLESLEPNVTFLMSLYLHPSITPETVAEAAKAGIAGIKSYPAGVTTNSSSGVLSYESFYPVFAEMESQNVVLNLHGECPSDHDAGITVLTAEERFLPTLLDLHRRFPKLRIVLEHCTTAAAIDAVKSCGPNVVGTITAHHLRIVVDDWAGDPFCFCKPVAKTPADRDALLRAVVSSDPKFFFGSDSAPHPATAKRGGDKVAAGVFTQPYATQLVLDALEAAVGRGLLRADEVSNERLQGFLGDNGRRFYGLDAERNEFIVLKKAGEIVQSSLQTPDGELEVTPFRKGEKTWSLAFV
ncbi:Dihydroorotase [Eremomyces bilateralis CBS 781.70]|uniref:dihydroorotase n=1 Tax=Eremomyces bilateralis CBS 781.70 TaxID=1392243 RepID=A0A6G1FXN3_9PEZI|nr:Dihydroorotase [Eremomyces bilateralis CBS 781.70]KAF1810472.1 Dihydroorotase [Eremomyces bilateralis CBS 781.70]